MTAAKIAISIDPKLLKRVDTLVRRKVFRSRSEVIQLAIGEQIDRYDDKAFARECSKLDPAEEQAMADVGLSSEVAEWPPF
jgi:metal-responsive CopG/Arc/MetJ family transcriptional regulator